MTVGEHGTKQERDGEERKRDRLVAGLRSQLERMLDSKDLSEKERSAVVRKAKIQGEESTQNLN